MDSDSYWPHPSYLIKWVVPEETGAAFVGRFYTKTELIM